MEISQRAHDGQWLVWRPCPGKRVASKWEIVAVCSSHEEADAILGLRVRRAAA